MRLITSDPPVCCRQHETRCFFAPKAECSCSINTGAGWIPTKEKQNNLAVGQMGGGASSITPPACALPSEFGGVGGLWRSRRRRFAGGFLCRMMCFEPPTSTLFVCLCECMCVCAGGVVPACVFPNGGCWDFGCFFSFCFFLEDHGFTISDENASCLPFRHETQESK